VWKVVAWLDRDQWQASLADLRWNGVALAACGMLLTAGICGAIAWYGRSRRAWARSLQQSEAKFRQMAEAIAEVFWLSGRDRRRLLYVSPAFTRIWGRPADLEQVAAVWVSAVHPDDQAPLARLHTAMASGEQFSERYRIVRPDGQIRWIWDQGFPVRENGTVSRYAGIAEDVTELQAAQAKLLQSERLVAVGEAITGLAHESRNALQRSQVCLEMLTKRVHDQPSVLDLAQRSQMALRELNQLYDRLRRFAAPIALDLVESRLDTIWDQAIADLQELLAEQCVTVSSQPDSVADLRCRVDPLALRQIFRNLIENAVDSLQQTPVAGRHIEIRWQAICDQQGRPAVRALIRDSGSGIEDSWRERIFEPFQTSKPYGTGLGLAIARRLVEAHHGRIEARNRADGQGLEMEIVLPRSLP
jgi:PAS domain S-box-containing protein